MKTKRIDLKNLIYNKRFLVVVSVLLSVIIWFVAMIVRNPVREETFTGIPVSISTENTSAGKLGLGVVSDYMDQKFTVKISGPNYIVSGVKPDDFTLSASVNEVTEPGTYSLSVVGTQKNNKKGYTFVSIEPSRIDVTFDYIDTKDFTLVPKITGVSAANGLVAEDPIISDEENRTITIKAPRSEMEKIVSVGTLAEADKSKPLSSSQTYDSDIVLYGKNDKILYRFTADGKIYDGDNEKVESTLYSLSFVSVKVTQPISKKATLNVVPKFSNLPSGLKAQDISYRVDHTVATVLGTPDVVSALTEITLSEIDLRQITPDNFVFEVEAALPDGVHIFDNIDKFKVTVDVSGYAQKYITVTNVKYSSLAADLAVKNNPSVKNVKICGPKSVIDEIRSGDVYAEINLSEKLAGQCTADVTIKSDKYTNFWQIGTYSASVTLAAK